VLQSRALARLYAGDNDGGLDDARRLLSSPAISHDRLALAEARNLVAIARRMMDDVEDARVEYAVVAAIYRDVGDVFGAAIGLVNLADCAIALDDLDSAERDLEAARPLVDECDSPQLIAYFHGNLGLVAQRRNDLEQARREFASAIATSEQIGDRQTVLNNLISFAAVLVDSDEPRAAYLAAAADALATRSALTPDPNEQKLWESTRDRLADRVDADLERARAEGRDASLRAVVDLVQSLVS
jgi:tetratricopeptide (TPR) repeat protein